MKSVLALQVNDSGLRDPRELHLSLWMHRLEINGGRALLGVPPGSPIDQ